MVGAKFQRMPKAATVSVIHILPNFFAYDCPQHAADEDCHLSAVAATDGRAHSAADNTAEHTAYGFTIACAVNNVIVFIPFMSGITYIIRVMLGAPAVCRHPWWRVGIS